MTFVLEEIFLRVQKLSRVINDLYEISPLLKLKILSNGDLGGTCNTAYQITNTYIELEIPHNLKMTVQNKALLDVMVMHEYCHYIEAFNSTGPERKSSSDLYVDVPQEKTRDEKKTWRQTKKLAEAIGLWTPEFYNAMQLCVYVSDLSYE